MLASGRSSRQMPDVSGAHSARCTSAPARLNAPPLSSAGKDIEKACQGIYPLQNVFIRKVKVLRSPKFDVTKLMEVHGDYTEEVRGA